VTRGSETARTPRSDTPRSAALPAGRWPSRYAPLVDKLKDLGEKIVGADPVLPLPDDRAQLMALHQAARRRRDGAPLLSEERKEASTEIERIEIHIARIERAMDPPLV
jgi:hypothetical protein